MSHAGQWLNTARRVLAHVRAYLSNGQYGERRDNELAQVCEYRHGESPAHYILTYEPQTIIIKNGEIVKENRSRKRSMDE